ncbi:hypothetical protein AB8810_16190 [Xanthomonas sp. NCPPB 3005]|uniref:hypothetical protein n=1 Tax=Xanthomonas sp. NCPPB 3005 TaxID=3240913 RepID=UPI0035150E2B
MRGSGIGGAYEARIAACAQAPGKKEEPANRLLDLVQRLSQAAGYAALTAA